MLKAKVQVVGTAVGHIWPGIALDHPKVVESTVLKDDPRAVKSINSMHKQMEILAKVQVKEKCQKVVLTQPPVLMVNAGIV